MSRRTLGVTVGLSALAVFTTGWWVRGSALALPACFGRPATIVVPTLANENREITGTDGDDVIVGGAGDDIIFGGRGDDRICARRGRDVVYGGRGTTACPMLAEGTACTPRWAMMSSAAEQGGTCSPEAWARISCGVGPAGTRPISARTTWRGR